jgi:hypothetical protein
VNRIDNLLLRKAGPFSLLLLLLAALAVLGLRLYFLPLPSPNLGAMEPNIIYGLQRVLAGLPLYTDPEQAPFSIIQYSPLYYGVVGNVGKMFGLLSSEVPAVYLLNRLGSLLFNLLSLGLMALILRDLRLPSKGILGAICLAWLMLEPAHYARPDSLQSLFFLLFFWSALRFLQRESWPYLLLSCTAAVLALWSKQNGLLLPVFWLFFLWGVEKRGKSGLLALLLMGGLFGLAWGIGVKDGAVFWAHVVKGVDNGISLPYFLDTIWGDAVKKFFLPMAGGLAFVGYVLLQAKSSVEQKLLAWGLLATWGWAALTALKWGSIPSYFTDFVHLAVIALSLAGWQALQSGKLSWNRANALGLVVGVAFFIPLHTSGKEWGRVLAEGRADPFAQAEAVREAVAERGLQPADYLFTHDFLLNLYFFPHCLFPQNDIVYCCAAPRNTYDYQAFNELYLQGQPRYVIDWDQERPRIFLGKSFAAYRKLASVGRYGIWEREE